MREVTLVGDKCTPGQSREENAVSVYETSRVAGVIHCEERIGTGPPRARAEVTNHARRAPLHPTLFPIACRECEQRADHETRCGGKVVVGRLSLVVRSPTAGELLVPGGSNAV